MLGKKAGGRRIPIFGVVNSFCCFLKVNFLKVQDFENVSYLILIENISVKLTRFTKLNINIL